MCSHTSVLPFENKFEHILIANVYASSSYEFPGAPPVPDFGKGSLENSRCGSRRPIKKKLKIWLT